MRTRIVSAIIITLLLVGMLTSAFYLEVNGSKTYTPAREKTDSISIKYDFSSPTITRVSGFDIIEIPKLPKYGSPGEPILPFKLVEVLIPQGKDVQSVDVKVSKKIFLEGKFKVDYGKTPICISSNFAIEDQPKSEIYNSLNPFPGTLSTILSEQFLRGYRILLLKLCPVQFVPKTGELYYFDCLSVIIHLKPSNKASLLFRNLSKDSMLVSSIVDNPEVENSAIVPDMASGILETYSSYDYVIITNNALRLSFQPLVDWKVQKGLSATIVSIEDILSNPNYHCNGLFGDGYGSPKFNDTQAHIRNFIKDAYQNWNIEYVLLGGDDEIIPARGVYGYAGYSLNESGIHDYNIPCDMYYGALDGSWDKDNDTIFGESTWHTRSWPGAENGTAGEEADFFAEVYVGRATVDTPQEAENFVNKTLAYEKDSQASYLKKILMIGQKLDDITEGGNTGDLVTDIISQYTTTRLYTRDGTFSKYVVINELNSGVHIVSHYGHSNPTVVMGLSRSDVDSLNNTEYFLVYSLGCSSAAFDEAKGGPNDAIGEHFVSATGGAFAYIGNSRYGFYCPACLDGPSDRYEISFFSVLNSGIRNLGKVLQLSKEQEPILDRWIYFTLNLLGDPETEIVIEIKAPTAHFETRTDLLAPPRIGGLVSIKGTAKRGLAPNSTFENFIIEFGEGTNPISWMTTGITLTNNGESEIINETLATWDTKQLTSGTYTLRLTVFDIEDQVGGDRHTVYVTPDAVPIYIRADGSIDPSTSPIQRNVDAYTLTDNIFSSSDGIVILRDNILLDGAGYMILGSGKEGVGIRLSERNNITIKNLEIREHCYGIYLEESSGVIIYCCNLVNNTHGIYLSGSSGNSIIGNDVTDNHDGVSLLSSSNNNEIVGNKIMSNVEFFGSGLYVYISSNNLIYHNTFVDNTMQVYDAVWDCSDPGLVSPSINIWNNGYPSGGNYWSDYTGIDANGDGIGDTPYTIDADNIDHYPIIHAWNSILSEQQVVALINGLRAYNYDLELETIAYSHYAFRAGGSSGANETANWIKEKFESFGLEAWLEPFEFTTWDLPSKPSLLTDDDGDQGTTNDQIVIPTFQSEHWSWPTPESGVFADLVTLPLPEATDIDELSTKTINMTEWNAIDTTGKILLIGREVSWCQGGLSTFKNKITAQPPVAIVRTWWFDWMSFVPDFFNSAGGRPISSWGPYFWDLEIPIGFVNYENGLTIRNRENAINISAHVSVNAIISTGTHYNVVGKISGYENPEKLVIVSSHYDTVMCSGFCDNGAGTAGVIELANVVAEAVENGIYKPRYTILFVPFTSEELYLVGSINYVKQHKSEMPNIMAVINLDCIGSDDFYVSETNPVNGFDLDQIILDAAQDLGIPATSETIGASDHETFRDPSWANDIYYYYWGLDAEISDATPVESSALLISYPLLYSEEWSTGTPGWIHTSYDNSTSTETLNWVEAEDLENHIKVTALTILRVSPDLGSTSVHFTIQGEEGTIEGNVTITNVVVTNSTLDFKASGESGSTGWINVTLPMINTTQIKVFVDRVKLTPPPFPVITSNGTHYFIYFEFTLSTHEIIILINKAGDLGGPVDYVPTFFAFDGKVDGYDLALWIGCYKGQAPPDAIILADLGGPANYIPTFFAYDGEVDGYDLALFIQCYKGLGP